MKKIVIVSILAILFTIAVIGEANANSGKENAAQPEKPSNLIVGFRENIPSDVDQKVKTHGAAVLSKNHKIHFVVIDPQGRDQAKLIEELRRLPNVAYVEPDGIVEALFDPNDPYYINNYQWGPQDINAPSAWDTTRGSSGIIIAIVDTGVNYNHPDIAPNYDNRGKNWINPSKSPLDDNGHGTHVAGIAAAVTNNGIGVAGISQSKILAEKVLNRFGSGTYSSVANGITDAADKGADIISMSLGGGDSYTMEIAVNYAWNNGSLIVAAAGNSNSGTISYPAAYANVTAVSALSQGDSKASYSNYGAKIELAAPGTDILSTYKNGYAYLSGTSMATPFVSGSAALVLSKNSSLTNQQVRDILDSSADDIGASGRDTYFGYGKVNPYRALQQTLP